MARSTARKRALNTLYEADEKGQDILSLLEERIAHPGAQTPLPEYAIEIVRGVAGKLPDIDALLNKNSARWQVNRMAVVDRNILRIAVWEILDNDEVPSKVAIDEALSLAKMLSESDSPAFIHGVLSAVDLDVQERIQQEEERLKRVSSAEAIAHSAEIESSVVEDSMSIDPEMGESQSSAVSDSIDKSTTPTDSARDLESLSFHSLADIDEAISKTR